MKTLFEMIEPLTEGVEVQFLGAYALKWKPHYTDLPTVGFRESEYGIELQQVVDICKQPHVKSAILSALTDSLMQIEAHTEASGELPDSLQAQEAEIHRQIDLVNKVLE